MMQLEALAFQDAAEASTSREWGRSLGQQAVLCPSCAVPLQTWGKRSGGIAWTIDLRSLKILFQASVISLLLFLLKAR
ncbi:hypothetical protein KSF_001310 [Reticulibacter mediterranei]|uniref:Uncharacterized protein n=1 Tax=Reticulibacter mediterranei TaxID=2778369 RepID=A0A8J3MZ57_9CHLR|nr:hypothetical protein [Reticulibacter mediterranei]GHO90083.1 hypothetical protein KSF_001310 [Reticulibacter mediterranei]